MTKEIISKYNIASPRYTSYPTILDWNRSEFDPLEFGSKFIDFERNKDHSTSVYIHLPFCESLCTFCGCHKQITKNHAVEQPYIDALIAEWEMYEKLNDGPIVISELYLGGGTPTFFSTNALKRLVQRITLHRADRFYFSVEGHPNHTTYGQMKALYELGFRRISFGVQDYSPEVQKSINRIQSFDQVQKVTREAREIGYTSVSHDLVFGLPHQTKSDLINSIEKTLILRPDTVSLYSYAHVPWVKGTGQRGFSEEDLPEASLKKEMYETGSALLKQQGYLEIGMDHFGLPDEPLTKAMKEGKLNRTFMGYTTSNSDRTIGLGVSAISEYSFGYAQNVKNLKEYHARIKAGKLPVAKGHIHSPLDRAVRKHIKSLMCNFETTYCGNSWLNKSIERNEKHFREFEQDGIIVREKNALKITVDGQPFVRNVCMALDPYMRKKEKVQRFSKSV
ncbi:MAG: oxygen-independent coproporphyrinogen III oxidase [Brumimicrobium sp.]|nr:oxygen-independent coproporphyrinogen III oxidase [Brumimicrobium sp.]